MADLLSCASNKLLKRVDTIKRDIPKVSVRPMNGGNDFHSYTQNSSVQRKGIEAAKELIDKSVFEKLDTKMLSCLKTFAIADVGCSVGPNTLMAVQNIVNAVRDKFKAEGKTSTVPSFQVFFNDQTSNDFNQLFTSLPPSKQYFAAGVPGSFYNRLFPDDSLHFVHSSFANHWLSRVPDQVLDQSSPAWNKGRVHFSNSTDEVIMAFKDQFRNDMNNFLNLRAQEIVSGGLLALILPGHSNGAPESKVFFNKAFEQLEYALVDMAKEGMIDEEKINSFNIAQYFSSLEEMESIVHRNGLFIVESMETIPLEMEPNLIPSFIRAILEGTIKEHFGEEILAELFETRLVEKMRGLVSITESCESVALYVLLKREMKD